MKETYKIFNLARAFSEDHSQILCGQVRSSYPDPKTGENTFFIDDIPIDRRTLKFPIGIADRNNQEIFGGDVLSFDDGQRRIFFDNGGYNFLVNDATGEKTDSFIYDAMRESVVVGNILQYILEGEKNG